MKVHVNALDLRNCAKTLTQACAQMTELLKVDSMGNVSEAPSFSTVTPVEEPIKPTVKVKTSKPIKVKIKTIKTVLNPLPKPEVSEKLDPVVDTLSILIADLARDFAWDSMQWQDWEKKGLLTKQMFLANGPMNAMYWLLRNCPMHSFYWAKCFNQFTPAELDLIEMQSRHSRRSIEFTETIREHVVPEYRQVAANNVYTIGGRKVLIGYSQTTANWGWRLKELNGRIIAAGARYKSDLLEYIKTERMKLIDSYKNGTDTRHLPYDMFPE